MRSYDLISDYWLEHYYFNEVIIVIYKQLFIFFIKIIGKKIGKMTSSSKGGVFVFRLAIPVGTHRCLDAMYAFFFQYKKSWKSLLSRKIWFYYYYFLLLGNVHLSSASLSHINKNPNYFYTNRNALSRKEQKHFVNKIIILFTIYKNITDNILLDIAKKIYIENEKYFCIKVLCA